MKKEIVNCLTWYANKVAEPVQYSNWSNEFRIREVEKATKKFLEALKQHIDFSKLTEEDAIELGFGKWDEETDLYLIPLYLLPILPIGIELTCIDGETIIYDGKNVDDDVRFGRIAYGITITK